MASYNRVIVAGNLVRDPEVRYTPSGMAVCELTLAVNDKRKNAQGEWVEEATFVDVTLWARQAEVAGEYLAKGANILIEGRLKLDTWEKDGQKRSRLKAVSENMQMLGGKAKGGNGSANEAQYRQDAQRQRDQPPEDQRPAPARRTMADFDKEDQVF